MTDPLAALTFSCPLGCGILSLGALDNHLATHGYVYKPETAEGLDGLTRWTHGMDGMDEDQDGPWIAYDEAAELTRHPTPADSDARELADTNEHDKWYDEGYRDGREDGAPASADGLRHRLLAAPDHILDGLTCWCHPYLDTEDPEIIIHRPEAKT